jgi:hypothetical protein
LRAGQRKSVGGVRSWLLPLVALAWLGATVAAGADEISVESKPESGFGRLIITFPQLKPVPAYQARISNGVFVLTFDEEVDIALDKKPLSLEAYFSIIRRDPDMKSFRFALGRAVRVNTQVAAERLFIDFLPPNWVGVPPPLPASVVAELAQRAERALLAAKMAAARSETSAVKEKLEVRVGRTETFTRLSFRWNVPFEANFSRTDKGVSILFNRSDAPDLSTINANPPPLLKSIGRAEADEGMTITLAVDPQATVRAFRSEDSYIVDLTSNAMQAAARDALSQVTPELLRQPALEDMVEIPGDPPAVAEVAASATAEPGADLGAAMAEVPESRAGAAALAGAPAEPAANRSAAVSQAAPAHNTPIEPSVTRSGAADQVVLPFPEPVAAAVFKRNGDLWIVVDSTAPLQLSPMRAELKDRVREISVQQLAGAQAVRLTLSSAQLVSVGVNGNDWIIGLGDTVLGTTQRVDLARAARPDGTIILTADFVDVGKVHKLRDPAAGDELIVVTGLGPPRGLLLPQDFVELATVPSAHGIVLAPRADDLAVEAAGNNVVIARKAGLSLSQAGGGADRAAATPQQGSDPARPGFLNIKRWTALPSENYVEAVEEMQGSIAAADEAERPGRRMLLADLYLSRQFGQETLGQMSIAAEENPALRSALAYRLTMLAAEILSGRYDEAWQRATEESLAADPDAALWRSIAGGAMREWKSVIGSSVLAETVLANYPDFVQEQYLLALTEAQIELDVLDDADITLTRFQRIEVSTSGQARRALLAGRLADAEGRTGDATQAFQKAIAFGPGPVEADAKYRLTEMQHKAGLMPAQEAAASFETISMIWRGDGLELKSLQRVSELKVASKDYRGAFNAMRQAEFADSKSPITEAIDEQMNKVFGTLYLDGKADEMAPVEALSLYYDFRELTPIGRRGDDMVRKLADRLIGVDLLEQAAELLHHQIDNRLRGAARAQIAADLAVVYLLDKRPSQALAVLRRTEQAQLPLLLDRQRRIVEARALSELKEPKAALEMLSSLEGDDVARMRAEIMWAAGDWRALAAQVEKMMGGRWSDALPLNARERRDVLRAGIAYALSDDSFGLERFRKKYLAKMANGPDATAFDVVTQPIGASSPEFRQIVAEIAASDDLQTFLVDYRARYLGGTDAQRTAGIPG